MNEILGMKGTLDVILKDKNGRVKDREFIDNLIVTVGKHHVIDQLVAQSQASMSRMAIGTGTTAATVADTALQTELSRKAFDSKAQGSSPNQNQLILTTTWGAGEGTGAITEAGVFNAASGGTMLNRAVFSVKNKGVDDILVIVWTVSIP